MKKLLSLVALLLTVSPLTWALDVDATAARAIAAAAAGCRAAIDVKQYLSR